MKHKFLLSGIKAKINIYIYITFSNVEIEKQYIQYNKQYTKVSSSEQNYKYFYRL